MFERGKKGKRKVQNIEYLENEGSFFGKLKSIFHNFWKAFLWWNIWKYGKIITINMKAKIWIFSEKNFTNCRNCFFNTQFTETAWITTKFPYYTLILQYHGWLCEKVQTFQPLLMPDTLRHLYLYLENDNYCNYTLFQLGIVSKFSF